jgi:dimethylaniline monooxygenase (N-oxide forming)
MSLHRQLVSSKYLTAFSDFRLPQSEKDFLTPQRYVEYLKAYATRFGLWNHIHLSTVVTSVAPNPTKASEHILITRGPQHEAHTERRYDAVAICSGLNQTPFQPAIPGLNIPLTTTSANQEKTRHHPDDAHPADPAGAASIHPGIKLLHSADFKARSQFGKDKTVLILGAGETAMDLAHLAITSPTVRRVILSHRDGFISSPKVVPDPFRAGGRSGGPDPANPNKPLDCATASLFDTAYVPPLIQRGPWLWAVYNAFVKYMAWAISGTTAGFDQWAGGVGAHRLHADSLLICKSDRALPFISEQYRSRGRLNRWRSWLINVELRPTGGRKIDLAPWPTHFDERGVVHFQENERPESEVMRREKGCIRPDVVVFATGYKQSFPFLSRGNVYPSLDECVTRGIYRNIEDGVAYIGFIRPAFGKQIHSFSLSQDQSPLL